MILWKGIEVEGPYKGIKTLFIGSKIITFEEISKILDEDSNINQLYFGAGICTVINESILEKCIKEYENKIITAEIDINELNNYNKYLLEKINVIITLTNKNFHLISQLSKVQIKIQTLEPANKKFLSIGLYKNFIDTDMKDYKHIIYKDDIVLK